ncbi:MAG: ferredoxin [Pseudanabaenaceae cyanobacterium bins.68]|nr:ferredoxin [Pseudanabaenaceae cyanobacterium bins.68]
MAERSGYEPELGGVDRQNAVYVDENTCIGCGHCAHVARSTFSLEPEFGRARVFAQDGDSEELIREAIATCPVDCIAWVSYAKLAQLERERSDRAVQDLGVLGDRSAQIAKRRRLKHLNQSPEIK